MRAAANFSSPSTLGEPAILSPAKYPSPRYNSVSKNGDTLTPFLGAAQVCLGFRFLMKRKLVTEQFGIFVILHAAPNACAFLGRPAFSETRPR
jgi:hypothetical protein